MLGAHPAVIRGHLSAAKGDHLLGGLLRPTRRMDPDGALEALLEGMYAGTASGTFPQISTSVDPVRMWVADFRERLRAGAEGVPLYGAVNLDLKLRRDLYARARLPASLDDDALMQCLGEVHAATWLQKLYWVQMFMGGGNTGMELHRDNLQNNVWGLQLSGKKAFVFCEPMAHRAAAMGAMGSMSGDSSGHINTFDAAGAGGDGGDEGVKRRAEVRATFEAKGKCWKVLLAPGDLVYWPSRWYHQSRNAADGGMLSIALSSMNVPRFRRAKDAKDAKDAAEERERGGAKTGETEGGDIHRDNEAMAEVAGERAMASYLSTLGQAGWNFPPALLKRTRECFGAA